MTVYVVTAGDYSDYSICGVFSSQEEAQKFIAAGRGEDIEEYELDAPNAEVKRTMYRCWLNKSDGSLHKEWTYETFVLPSYRGESIEWEAIVGGISTESPEHARKLAAEARQAWLRKQAGS